MGSLATAKDSMLSGYLGEHGSYTFYKYLKIESRCLTVSNFFPVRIYSDSAIFTIAQLHLLWSDRVENYISLKLYFLPENTPEGRKTHHGEDELIALQERVVLRVADFSSWLVDDSEWHWGYVFNKNPQKRQKVLVLTYLRYVRLRSLLKRLEGVEDMSGLLNHPTLQALGGVKITPNTHLLFYKETFDYPELEDHELLCNHLAPKLKGRPRKRKRRREQSIGSESSKSISSSYSQASSSGMASKKMETDEVIFVEEKRSPPSSLPPKKRGLRLNHSPYSPTTSSESSQTGSPVAKDESEMVVVIKTEPIDDGYETVVKSTTQEMSKNEPQIPILSSNSPKEALGNEGHEVNGKMKKIGEKTESSQQAPLVSCPKNSLTDDLGSKVNLSSNIFLEPARLAQTSDTIPLHPLNLHEAKSELPDQGSNTMTQKMEHLNPDPLLNNNNNNEEKFMGLEPPKSYVDKIEKKKVGKKESKTVVSNVSKKRVRNGGGVENAFKRAKNENNYGLMPSLNGSPKSAHMELLVTPYRNGGGMQSKLGVPDGIQTAINFNLETQQFLRPEFVSPSAFCPTRVFHSSPYLIPALKLPYSSYSSIPLDLSLTPTTTGSLGGDICLDLSLAKRASNGAPLPPLHPISTLMGRGSGGSGENGVEGGMGKYMGGIGGGLYNGGHYPLYIPTISTTNGLFVSPHGRGIGSFGGESSLGGSSLGRSGVLGGGGGGVGFPPYLSPSLIPQPKLPFYPPSSIPSSISNSFGGRGYGGGGGGGGSTGILWATPNPSSIIQTNGGIQSNGGNEGNGIYNRGGGGVSLRPIESPSPIRGAGKGGRGRPPKSLSHSVTHLLEKDRRNTHSINSQISFNPLTPLNTFSSPTVTISKIPPNNNRNNTTTTTNQNNGGNNGNEGSHLGNGGLYLPQFSVYRSNNMGGRVEKRDQ